MVVQEVEIDLADLSGFFSSANTDPNDEQSKKLKAVLEQLLQGVNTGGDGDMDMEFEIASFDAVASDEDADDEEEELEVFDE